MWHIHHLLGSSSLWAPPPSSFTNIQLHFEAQCRPHSAFAVAITPDICPLRLTASITWRKLHLGIPQQMITAQTARQGGTASPASTPSSIDQSDRPRVVSLTLWSTSPLKSTTVCCQQWISQDWRSVTDSSQWFSPSLRLPWWLLARLLTKLNKYTYIYIYTRLR